MDDARLIKIVDSAMAEAARRSGSWLACRPGCTQCCIGPFPINQLDAIRLRRGLAELTVRDPERAARVRERARLAVVQMSAGFPGDPATGIVTRDDESFCEQYGIDPCPALDPETGSCDLYAARPITCRTFGPAVRCNGGEALAVCELCYRGIPDEQIVNCEIDFDPEGLEAALLDELEAPGDTFIAWALAV